MAITIDIKKTVEQNAETYFQAGKKAKKKVDGAKKALVVSYAKLDKLKLEGLKIERKLKDELEKGREEKAKKVLSKSQEKWFHKFRWFISSEGFLVIGGRDSTTNEIVIKKYLDNNDLVFHTELAGSPFFIIKASSEINKSSGNKIGKETIQETADACASFSRAWKLGVSNTQTFYVNPDQVTKEAKAGEYIQKGSFMVMGKRNFLNGDMKLAIAQTDNGIMCGPVNAVKKHALGKIIMIQQGNDKTSDLAKEIRKMIGGDLDEIIRVLPQGCKIAGR
ncbi:MAG: NFACT RNA binding domain-containing protein [Nanoarchaeota archaeon]|nr:NFACT RNA binding domain-containing protein [Nanoarchaeota archaeon]